MVYFYSNSRILQHRSVPMNLLPLRYSSNTPRTNRMAHMGIFQEQLCVLVTVSPGYSERKRGGELQLKA